MARVQFKIIAFLFTLSLLLTCRLSFAAEGQGNLYKLLIREQAVAAKVAHSYHHAVLSSSTHDMVLRLEPNEVVTIIEQGGTLIPLNEAELKRKRAKARSTTKSDKQNTNAYVSANLPLFEGIPGYSCYPTVEATYAMAEALSQQFPNLAEWKTVGESWRKANGQGGFDLKVLVLGNQQGQEDKPKLLLQSAMHAREYATAALTMEFAGYLLSRYETDADVNWVLNEREIHILFVMNPDGRKEAEKGLYWRKNANANFCPESPDKIGVDLNRNFSFKWNTTENGSSGEACASNFRGDVAASEPETQVVESYIRSLFDDHRGAADTDAADLNTQGLHLDIHSYGSLVVWPWGHDSNAAPNGPQLQTLGRKFAAFNGYRAFQAVGMYPTDGTIDDFVYGELGIPSFVFELGTQFFETCEVYQQQVLPTNIPALLYAAKVADAPYVKPAGPNVIGLRLQGAGQFAIPAGTEIKLTATVSDNFYQYLPDEVDSAKESVQSIDRVEYVVKNADDNATILEGLLLPEDGLYDTVTEEVYINLATASLSEGDYHVFVTAIDSSGQPGAVSARKFTINNASEVPTNTAPEAAFSVECAHFLCVLDASDSQDDQGIIEYRWTIDDEIDLYGKRVEFSYDLTKDYEFELSVVDGHDLTSRLVKRLSLIGNTPPVAEFSYDCEQLQCQFDATASRDPDGKIEHFLWYVNDEKLELEASLVSHRFDNEGIHRVELVVVDEFGAYQISEKQIELSKSSGGGSFNWMACCAVLLLSLGRRTQKLRNPIQY